MIDNIARFVGHALVAMWLACVGVAGCLFIDWMFVGTLDPRENYIMLWDGIFSGALIVGNHD